MRPEFDSEIDSVLRGHARRGGASSPAWDAAARPSISNEAQAGSHLDADEIAAFGEDALPAAARSRYSAHLADCDDCRRSVTQVAFAAGVADRLNERAAATAAAAAGRAEDRVRAEAAAAAYATRSPSAETESPSVGAQSPSWRERLSSLFAPRAWRYAMPVVALFALGAIIVVVINNNGPLREGASEMARRGGNAEQRPAAPAVSETPAAHHADANQQQPGVLAETQASNTGAAAGASASDESGETAGGEELAKARPKGAGGADQSAAVGAAAPSFSRTEVAQLPRAEPAPPPSTANYAINAQPSPVPPTPAPAAAAPRAPISRDGAMAETVTVTPAPAEQETSARAREQSRAVARDEAPATKPHGPQRGTGRRAAGLSADAMKDDRAAAARPARGPQNNSANAAGANRNDTDEAKAKREEDREKQEQQRAETRAVGGRRFRREGNVWIDTAYRAGQATVSVRRDSEQYRALVADEPEIGQISRALGGEAVIVWKGRAYRVKP